MSKKSIVKAGCLLIAEPYLGDPNFERSVVLICEYNEAGAFGLVLNQLSELKLEELVGTNINVDIEVNFGGPVERNTLHYVHCRPDIIIGGRLIINGLTWGGDFDQIKEMLNLGVLKPNEIKFFLGYSGWGAGQLENEINKNSWVIGKTNSTEILNSSANSFWREVLKNMGGDFKVMANYPTDPRLN